MTLASCLAEAAARFGPAPALVAENGLSLSYADLHRLSDEVAAGLLGRGVGEGDVVALMLPTIPEYHVAYLAAVKVGAITTGVNLRLSQVERRGLLRVADPKLVLAAPEVEPAETSEDLLADLRVPGEAPPTIGDDPDRPVAIVFTSGTTGAPKGALFCNRQLDAVTAIDVGDRWGGGGRGLASTSLAHLAGCHGFVRVVENRQLHAPLGTTDADLGILFGVVERRPGADGRLRARVAHSQRNAEASAGLSHQRG